MSSSISWRFPGASSVVFTWEMFLAGPAPAGRITLVLWDGLGQKGTCQPVKQQVAAFLKEEHCSGAISSQLLAGVLAGQWPERSLPGCGRAPAAGKHLSSGAACHQACPDCSVRGDVTTLQIPELSICFIVVLFGF